MLECDDPYDERPASLSEALEVLDRRPELPPFVMRQAMPADTMQIDNLFRASYGELLRADYSAATLAKVLPSLLVTSPRLLNSGTFFVAETGGGDVIAAGGWTQASPFGGVGPREIGHMRRVAVHPDYVRRGVGSVILDHVLANAQRTGVTRMCCLSTLTAQPFYEAHGFAMSGDVDLMLRPGVALPAVQMARDLNA